MNKTLEYFMKQYPDSIVSGTVDINTLSRMLDIYNMLKHENNFEAIEEYGLNDIIEDVNHLGDDEFFMAKLRKQKLDTIL